MNGVVPGIPTINKDQYWSERRKLIMDGQKETVNKVLQTITYMNIWIPNWAVIIKIAMVICDIQEKRYETLHLM